MPSSPVAASVGRTLREKTGDGCSGAAARSAGAREVERRTDAGGGDEADRRHQPEGGREHPEHGAESIGGIERGEAAGCAVRARHHPLHRRQGGTHGHGGGREEDQGAHERDGPLPRRIGLHAGEAPPKIHPAADGHSQEEQQHPLFHVIATLR